MSQTVGSVVVSVDAELGWGFHDLPSPPADRVEAGRAGWKSLLDLFDEYDVPATWAVVGHLFLEDCDRRHDDHPTPPGWFAREHGEWRDRADLRFGADLVRDLLAAGVDHDVGCHTFSHVVGSDPRVTPEVVAAELAASAAAAEPYGVDLESFVFPRNAVAHRDVLAEFGVAAYRGSPPRERSGLLERARKVGLVGRFEDPLVRPARDEYGLVNVPPSQFLFGFEGLPRTAVEAVWADPVVRRARRGIDRAATEPGVFHAWLHPNNLVEDRDRRRVEAVLEHVDRRRRETDLTVETMADVAARL